MITIQHCKLGIAIAALFATSGAFAGTMSNSEYSNAKDRISIDYKADKSACETFSGNAEDICQVKASGKEKVARAQLEYDYSGKASDADKLAVAVADSDYATAKKLCDDKAGDAKEVCNTEAKAGHTTALANSTMTKKAGEAREEANEDTRAADYTVAKAKCESLAGSAKASCINTAKANFGKD